jgi:multisubunit Na+/H+ antiporter MnhF subunit
MAIEMHEGAPHHLPPFITAPGQTDYFFNGSVIFLVVMVVVVGTLYFRLHALPEHLAHHSENKLQFQLVGALALLALFTHNTSFWVAALLLALIRIPDFQTPLSGMADSLSRLARGRKRAADDQQPAVSEPEKVAAPQIAAVSAEPSKLTDATARASASPASAEIATDTGLAASDEQRRRA